jgi:hypothetical protein
MSERPVIPVIPAEVKDKCREALQQIAAVAKAMQEETFVFEHAGHTFVWNVTQAERILENAPREVEWFHLQEQGVTVEHIRERYPDLDWEYAKAADLSCPLLFVPFAGNAQMIDGWHRLARAAMEGIPELPAYLLTEAEANDCLVLHLPAVDYSPSLQASPDSSAGKVREEPSDGQNGG